MKKKKKVIIAIGIVFLLLISYFGYDHLMYVNTDNAQVQGHALILAPKVSGFIEKVYVEEGDAVQAGQVLAEIAPQEFENILAEVKADLSSISAKMKETEKNYFRLLELYKKSVVSQQQYDQANSAYNSIKAQYESMQAKEKLAELNLGNSKISAPSRGFIVKRSAEVGQLANQGVPLFGFVDDNQRWVIANFKETEIDKIKIGNKVYIDVDAITSKTFSGKVASIYSATGATFTLLPPDNATGNFTKVVQRVPVKIIFDDVSAENMSLLKVGLSAVVKVKK